MLVVEHHAQPRPFEFRLKEPHIIRLLDAKPVFQPANTAAPTAPKRGAAFPCRSGSLRWRLDQVVVPFRKCLGIPLAAFRLNLNERLARATVPFPCNSLHIR